MTNERSTRIWVGSLSNRVDEHQLRDVFGRYGPISKVQLKFGYAFIVSNAQFK